MKQLRNGFRLVTILLAFVAVGRAQNLTGEIDATRAAPCFLMRL